MQCKLQKGLYPLGMSTYGERLAEAIAYREKQLGRAITRLELSKAAGCSRQNIGMILTGAQGDDQKLSTERHAKAAAFLKVDSNWLLNGAGDMTLKTGAAPKSLSDMAEGLAVLFDMIPPSDVLRRTRAYAIAWDAIRRELPPDDTTGQK